MNNYQEDYEDAVEEILSTTLLSQQKVVSAQTSAQYDLYYAQGAQITAEDKLKKVVSKYDYAQDVDKQGVENDNLATNLLSTTNATTTLVSSTAKEAATAAANLNVAANAIAKVAADIGAACNLARGADYGTDIFHLAKSTNKTINEVSYLAQELSNTGMEASTDSAEIIAKVVQTETQSAKSEVEALLKATTAEFSKLQQDRAADNARVAATSVVERAAEGALLDVQKEASRVLESLQQANKELNYNLAVTPMPSLAGDLQASVSFDKFEFPIKEDKKDMKRGDWSKSVSYFVVFVESSKKSQFNLDKVEMDRAHGLDYFFDVSPGEPQTLDLSNRMDADGQWIKAGSKYVAFLFIKLPETYKQKIANFSNVLSAPTSPFTLTHFLPVPVPDANTMIWKRSGKKITSVSFEVRENIPVNMEYRGIFLSANTPAINTFLTSDFDGEIIGGEASESTDRLGFYFNLPIAEQVSAGNYTLAKRDRANISTNLFTIELTPETTDNFGNELIDGQKYFLIILAYMDSDNGDYANKLSALFEPKDYLINPSTLAASND